MGESLAPEEKELVSRSKEWALANGLVQRVGDDTATFIPFALFPSRLPRKIVQEALELQPALNELYFNVSQDHEFLLSSLQAARAVDTFIDKLCSIIELLDKPSEWRPVSAAVVRNDLMIDTSRQNGLSQVEFNTISCAFLGLSQKVAELHGQTLRGTGFCDCWQPAFVVACKLGELWSLVHGRGKRLAILFVVLAKERNFADQLVFESHLTKQIPESQVFYVTLTEMGHNASVDGQGNLFYRQLQVGMVYFRAGYSPEHYPTDTEWQGRIIMERSNCILIPTIPMQVAGVKQIQAELGKQGIVERYLTDERRCQAGSIRSLFTGLRSLDSSEDLEQAKKLVQSQDWLLKPLREGGSQSNISNKKEILRILESKLASRYMLQKKIATQEETNILVFPGKEARRETVVSELGVFGIVTSRRDGSILGNTAAGLLMRTKPANVEQGGIVAGYGAINSVSLSD